MLLKEEYKILFKDLVIPAVSKVISLTKLRKNYKSFEAKRQLRDSYDLFLTDNRIVTFLPAQLGKAFYTKKKIPIPIDLKRKSSITKQIEKCRNSTCLFINTGACLAVKIAKTNFTEVTIFIEALLFLMYYLGTSCGKLAK